MKMITEPTIEIRKVDEKSLEMEMKTWMKLYQKAGMYKKLADCINCVFIYNIKEKELYLLHHKNWADWCRMNNITKRTANRHYNTALGLIKKCPKAVMLDGEKFVFDASKIEAEFKAYLKVDGDVTLEKLAQIGAEANELRNYFFDEQAGADITTEDALGMLLGASRNAPATEDSLSKPSILPEYLDPFIKAYAAEHKLKWDKIRGWVNADDSNLSEQQKIDMTLSKEAVACPSEITRMIASECKTLEKIIEQKSEFYLNGLKKNSPSVSEAIDNHFKEANTVMERIGACIGELQEGNIEKALWALRSSAAEFFGTSI